MSREIAKFSDEEIAKLFNFFNRNPGAAELSRFESSNKQAVNSPDIIEEMLEFPPPTRFQRRNSTLNANIDLENVAESRNKTEEPNKASKM